MKRTASWMIALAAILAVGVPVSAQRGGGNGKGVGGVVGGVAGAATGTVGGAVSAPQGKSGSSNTPPQNAPAHQGGGVGADVSLHITQNAQLSAQLQPLVPSGATLAGAAAGFHNQGQFISALHVAHNLNIPFDQLKAKMTGDNAGSLGKAIRDLRPDLSDTVVKDNTKLAERQAERDVKQAASKGKPDPLATRIASDKALASRLQSMLPAGTTLENAAAGFKNDGQFIAALQVSKNLNIPFADLKDRMTAGQALGQAIHDLKPSLSEEAAEAAAKEAEQQSRTIRAEASESGSASGQANTSAKP